MQVKKLIPAPIFPEAVFDPIARFPDDVTRLVAVATTAGYLLSPTDAGEIWKRVSDSVCATWQSPSSWGEAEILAEMTRYGVSVDTPNSPPVPPRGYASRLDYAVDMIDTRSAELDHLFEDGPDEGVPTRESMRQAVRAELDEVRQRAGIHGQHSSSKLMGEVPEKLPQSEGWDNEQTASQRLGARRSSEPTLVEPHRRPEEGSE